MGILENGFQNIVCGFVTFESHVHVEVKLNFSVKDLVMSIFLRPLEHLLFIGERNEHLIFGTCHQRAGFLHM